MRNIFDQYSQLKNKLPHVLGCDLSPDRSLLRTILDWLGAAPPKIPS